MPVKRESLLKRYDDAARELHENIHAPTLTQFGESYRELQQQVKILRQTNSDLNKAIRERNLELENFSQREYAAVREKSYDEWKSGADETLHRLELVTNQVGIEGKAIQRRRRREVAILASIVIVDCLCLGTIAYTYLFR